MLADHDTAANWKRLSRLLAVHPRRQPSQCTLQFDFGPTQPPGDGVDLPTLLPKLSERVTALLHLDSPLHAHHRVQPVGFKSLNLRSRTMKTRSSIGVLSTSLRRSEERRVGKECRSRW